MHLVETSLKVAPERLLAEYAVIESSFVVNSVLELLPDSNSSGFPFVEATIKPARIKNYDACEAPARWARQWNLENWVMIRAYQDDIFVGGCLVAHSTSGVDMLEARADISVLWDIRVAGSHRNSGVGSVLFREALEVSRRKECRFMKIETQNTNVAACRFYQKQGCELVSIKEGHYDDFPEEIQLIWKISPLEANQSR